MSGRAATAMLCAATVVGAALLTGCAGGARAPERASPTVRAEPAPIVESTEPWQFDNANGRIVRTAHYRIFTTETDLALNERLPGFLEDAMGHYRTALGPLPPPPMRLDTYLMNNRDQWQRLTLRLMGPAGEPFLKIGRGGFATRGVAALYDIGTFDTLAVAAHEGWHQYTQRTFKDGLPVWLEEGIATYMEGHRWDGNAPMFLPWANVERHDRLRDALSEGVLRPLSDLLGMTPQDTLGRVDKSSITYYAQVWALTHFLKEGENGRYSEAFRTLLSDAADGRMTRVVRTGVGERAARLALATRTGSAVFEAYFGADLAEIDHSYQVFIRQIVATGSRDAVVAGRSPLGPAR